MRVKFVWADGTIDRREVGDKKKPIWHRFPWDRDDESLQERWQLLAEATKAVIAEESITYTEFYRIDLSNGLFEYHEKSA